MTRSSADDKQGHDYSQALALAITAARAAGAALRDELRRPDGPRGAGSHCVADEEIEATLRDALEAHDPRFGVRGEELPSRDRAPHDPDLHCWWIDPHDGTSSYMRGWRGTTVSIGLTRGDTPVLGVIFAFAWPDDDGTLYAWAEGMPHVTRDDTPLARDWSPWGAGQVALISQDADRCSSVNAALVAPGRYQVAPGIASRLAWTAAGLGDAAVSLYGPSCWDIAAGHALVRGAGGELVDQDGKPPRYLTPSRLDRVFAGSASAVATLVARDWSRALSAPSEAQPRDLAKPSLALRVADAASLRRAQGCWLGQLSGDALGALVEFQQPAQILARYPDGGPSLLADGGTWDTLAGQPTDDSELALALARALVARGGFDLDAIASHYADWIASAPFDMGQTTAQALGPALGASQQGQPPAAAAQAAASLESQANGALMRVSPLGILGAGAEVDEVMAWARADASLTHPHPVCQDASAIFAATIARAIQHGDTPNALYHWALTTARERALHPDVISSLEQATSGPPHDLMYQMGWVRLALQNAYAQLLRAPSFEAGVRDTVARGGDTDTNAAIAGALLGAAHGRDALPAQWTRAVLCCRPIQGLATVRRPRPRWLWPVDALTLAEHLLATGLQARG